MDYIALTVEKQLEALYDRLSQIELRHFISSQSIREYELLGEEFLASLANERVVLGHFETIIEDIRSEIERLSSPE